MNLKQGYAHFFTVFFLFIAPAAFATQPNANWTPGELCSQVDPNFMGFYYLAHVARCKRNVNHAEKAEVAQAYGVPESDWPQYEFDHLIPLCAGGANSIANLWPQPIHEAKEKDVVEDEVCRGLQNGTMTQDEGVARIQQWIAQH